MTRDSKTISAVFMAVVLVLASGAAVSFAVTATDGSNSVGLASDPPDQETTTEDDGVGEEEETTTEDDGTTDDEATDEQEEETTTEDDEATEDDGATTTEDDEATTTEDDEATTTEDDGTTAEDDATDEVSITFDAQTADDGEEIVVDSATLPEGGFVAIYESAYETSPVASVLGHSAYLEAGQHENITISLARPLEESATVVAVPHLDTNDNEVFDYVLSTGEMDGWYESDGEASVIQEAEVTVEQETTTTTEAENETTTTTEAEDEVTTEEEAVETTTEEDVVETTTEEDVIETTTEEEEVETTTEEDVVETTTEEDVVETTTEEEEAETTTEEEEVETTTEETQDDEMEQFVFKVEQMNVDRWSFVVGDEETPDETVYVNGSELLPPDGSLSDERVTINLSELQQQGAISQDDLMYTTTRSPEEIEEDVEENLTEDVRTVRYVVQNVSVENATLVILAPSDVDFPAQSMATTVEDAPTDDDDDAEDDADAAEAETTTTTAEA